MSIKLSLKELKDLLKIQTKKIKKKRRYKKKTKGYENNIRSSSTHMISGGIPLINTANEQTELIRLQRQSIEDKLKEDKLNKIKKENKEKYDNDVEGDIVPYNALQNSGGSNDLRNVHNTINYILGELPAIGKTLIMPPHGHGGDPNTIPNVKYDPFDDVADDTYIYKYNDENDKNASYDHDVDELKTLDTPKKTSVFDSISNIFGAKKPENEADNIVKADTVTTKAQTKKESRKNKAAKNNSTIETKDNDIVETKDNDIVETKDNDIVETNAIKAKKEKAVTEPAVRKSTRYETTDDPKTVNLTHMSKAHLIAYLNINKYKGRVIALVKTNIEVLRLEAFDYQQTINASNDIDDPFSY